VSGRHEQLGRQLRKVRTSLAKQDLHATAVALRRATHLAIDLLLEGVETDDVAAAIEHLVNRRVVDTALGERLASALAIADDRDAEPTPAEVAERGRDLDRVLRSLEHGAAMPELPFAALEVVEVPAAQSRAALTISGRQVVVAGRGGEGLVFIDDRPVSRPFPMTTAPTSKAAIHRDPSGRTRIAWESEGLAIELGPDFATAVAGT
jgi:hypothetical protein